MSNPVLKPAINSARAVFLLAMLAPAPALAGLQSNDAAVDSAAKLGVYKDVDANLAQMAAIRQEKASAGEAAERISALLGRASPPVREWARLEAQRQAIGDPSVPAIAAAARERFGNDLADGDIDQIAQLVMAEVARQADEELRGQLAQMQAANHQKQARRDEARELRRKDAAPMATSSAELQARPSGSRVELAASVTRASDGKDSLDELGEMDQLRLQMLMVRRQKALETLDNLMKKTSDTSSTIIGNLK